jgi:hypothetical protein
MDDKAGIVEGEIAGILSHMASDHLMPNDVFNDIIANDT